MQLARLMPSIGRLPSVRPSKALPLALGAHAASPAGSGAWGAAGAAAAARRCACRLHTAAAASQEQLAKQPRDNEDAQPTTIADPGQNPLFWPFVVRRACAMGGKKHTATETARQWLLNLAAQGNGMLAIS